MHASGGSQAASALSRWGSNERTVSNRGLSVSPERNFHSVVNGTPDRCAICCIWACPKASNKARRSAALGMYGSMPTLYRIRYAKATAIGRASAAQSLSDEN